MISNFSINSLGYNRVEWNKNLFWTKSIPIQKSEFTVIVL